MSTGYRYMTSGETFFGCTVVCSIYVLPGRVTVLRYLSLMSGRTVMFFILDYCTGRNHANQVLSHVDEDGLTIG